MASTHRDAERGEAADERQHLLTADRVESGRRLVEQHQLRVGHQRLRQLRALAHAGREAVDRPEAAPRPARPGRARRTPAGGRPGPAGRPARRRWPPRRPRSGRGGRQSCSGMKPSRRRTPTGSSATARPHTSTASVGRADEAEQQPEQRGLARAVGPDEPDRPAGDRHGQPVERGGASPGTPCSGSRPRRRGRGPLVSSVAAGPHLRPRGRDRRGLSTTAAGGR